MLDKQLYLTRIESQNNDMYFEYVPLKRLIIEEIQLTRYLSQAKGIGYELDLDESHHVYTDSKWCRMMIRQIFSNAIKYSENGTIYVKSSPINGQIQVQIKDEGRGISKKIYREFLIKVSPRRIIEMKRLPQVLIIFSEYSKRKFRYSS